MAYVFAENRLGQPPITQVDTVAQLPLGTILRAYDPTYGSGEFMYVKGVASTAIGSWVLILADDWSTTLLAADMKGQVGVAMSANVASSYGWVQISGKAIGKALTGYLDNALVYATATAGSVDDAVVSGDRIKNAIGASAVDTPSAGFAEFEINRPFVDDGSAT